MLLSIIYVFYLYTCVVFQAPTFNEPDLHCKSNRQQNRFFGMLATNFCALYYHLSEPEEGPPHPRSGGGLRLRGLMLRRRAVLGTPKCEKSVGRRGSAPDLAGGAYSAPPDPLSGREGLRGGFAATYNIVIVLVLCVCTHVYENALLFSLEC